MYKAIENTRTGIIHAAYSVNAPVTHCGGVGPYSEDIKVHKFTALGLRNATVTCKNCLRMLGDTPKKLPPVTEKVLARATSNIKDAVKTFVEQCPDCRHMITNRGEPMYRCRHHDNKFKTCEWVFCPL